MRVLLVGHGRLGQAIETLCLARGIEVAGVLDETNNQEGCGLVPGRWAGVDVAIDASTADAFLQNVPKILQLGLNMVVGTTGWQSHEGEVRRAVEHSGIGAVVASNFSIGAVAAQVLAERAAAIFSAQPDYSAWIHEAHHSAKRDAPSGTALGLKRAIEQAGYDRPTDVSSTRAGFIPGTHTVGFEGRFDNLTITHTVRDRTVFAEGALAAARWVLGRSGWFTMRDVLGMDNRESGTRNEGRGSKAEDARRRRE
jgi:4-hydroxy-tetrahydrodipicolinate reductase